MVTPLSGQEAAFAWPCVRVCFEKRFRAHVLHVQPRDDIDMGGRAGECR